MRSYRKRGDRHAPGQFGSARERAEYDAVYSFGGWLAANLAVRAPERLASLTPIDPVRTFADFPAALLVRTALTVIPEGPAVGTARLPAVDLGESRVPGGGRPAAGGPLLSTPGGLVVAVD